MQRDLELRSPHLMNHDSELWTVFIHRDVPFWEDYIPFIPEEPSYETYRELCQKSIEAMAEDAARTKSALEVMSSEKAKNGVYLVKSRDKRFPKERPTEKQRYAAYDRKMGGIKPVFVPATAENVLRGTGKPKNPLDEGVWTFERPTIPRETQRKPTGIFAKMKPKKTLSVPTHKLASQASRVAHAPRSLVEAHRQPAQLARPKISVPPNPLASNRSRSAASASAGTRSSSTATPKLRASMSPKRTIRTIPKIATQATTSAPAPSIQEREAKLRALTARPAKFNSPPTPVSSPISRAESAETTVASVPAQRANTIDAFSPIRKPRPEPKSYASPPDEQETSEAVEDDEYESAPQPPARKPRRPSLNRDLPRPTIRKRADSSCFIQPKRRKATS